MNASLALRDRRAYQLAREYLLGFGADGVTEELLAHYITPPESRLRPRDLCGVYLRLLESAQNRGMMATVIGESIGGVEALGPVLSGFDPRGVLEQYTSSDAVLEAIEAGLHPRGQLRRNRGSLWPTFARSVLSGAQFLAQFRDADDFFAWVESFVRDARSQAALPLVLSREIAGYGFALACDFLKEIGFLSFSKPDVHVMRIVEGLGLCPAGAGDYAVFKTMVRIASHCEVTPYNVDKVFWLVGSGRFYDHPHLGTRGRISTDRDAFVREARAALDARA